MNWKRILLSLVVMGSGTLHAQVKELDPLTVVSSLTELKASQTGREIIVLQGKDIEALPVKTLDDLLRYIPGMEVQSRGDMGAQSDFMMRGGNFQQVLVVLDGLRIKDANTGHFSSYIPVHPAEIEKIEILKGPASSIYGSDAVGGVISITTKTFSRQQQEQHQTSGSVAAGEYGLLNASLTHAGGSKNTRYQISALSNNTNGPAYRGINGYMHQQQISTALNHQIKDWNIGVRVAYDDRKFAAQNFYTAYASDTAKESVKVFWTQVGAVYQKNKDKISLLGGFKNTQDNFLFNNSAAENVSFSNLYQFNASIEHRYHPGSVLVSGIQYLGRNIVSNDRGNHSLTQLAGFSDWQQQFSKNWNANTSIRFDWYEVTGLKLVPQFNLSYHQDDVQIRSGLGYTVRYADFTELYNNYNQKLITSGRVGNPALAPEHTFNLESGIDWSGLANTKITVGIFQRNAKDLIDWMLTPYASMPRQTNLAPTGNFLLASNLASVTTTGEELNIQYHHALKGKTVFRAIGGLMWLNNSSDNPLSLYLSSAAHFVANGSFVVDAPRYSLAINGLYKARDAQAGTAIIQAVQSDYYLVNVKASIKSAQNKWALFVSADNLMNTTYNDYLGALMPGRWLQGGIRFNLHP